MPRGLAKYGNANEVPPEHRGRKGPIFTLRAFNMEGLFNYEDKEWNRDFGHGRASYYP